MSIEFLQQVKQRIDQCLQEQISEQQSDFCSQSTQALDQLTEAMLYSTANGGKRLRPALFIATAEALQTHTKKQLDDDDIDLIASSIECIHSYSLVHDDLPAMDDDVLRRGQATCHVAYNEAIAILVGDGLQTLAFELLTKTSLTPKVQVQLIKELAKASGKLGMIGGQAIDINSENKTISLKQLEQLHALKTGALIRASVRLAAISLQTSELEFGLLDEFASKIGLAFQVHDDVLDIESDTQTLGKTQGADIALNKSTYPSLIGLGAAKEKSEALINSAFSTLDQLHMNTDTLKSLANFVIARSH